MMRATVTHAG